MNEDLYKQHILDHFNNPRNKRQMEDPDIEEVAKNASCGDSYILYVKIQDSRIKDVTFSGVGCAISTAAASILTEKIRGMEIKEVKQITEQDIYTMLGVPISIGREKCALLLFNALQRVLNNL